MSKINPSGKELLISLGASVAISREMFQRGKDTPLTLDMIGTNWMAEKVFLSHQENGNTTSSYKLKSGGSLEITESKTQIIIQEGEGG